MQNGKYRAISLLQATLTNRHFIVHCIPGILLVIAIYSSMEVKSNLAVKSMLTEQVKLMQLSQLTSDGVLALAAQQWP